MALRGSLEVETGPDAVAFALTVHNGGDDAAELTFSDAQRVAVTVRDDDGVVWESGGMFAQVLGTETVPAGGERTFGVEWADPEPGEYEAEAALATDDADVAATATVSV